MCILHFVSILLTLLISAILSNTSFIKLSSLLSGYPASSLFIYIYVSTNLHLTGDEADMKSIVVVLTCHGGDHSK